MFAFAAAPAFMSFTTAIAPNLPASGPTDAAEAGTVPDGAHQRRARRKRRRARGAPQEPPEARGEGHGTAGLRTAAAAVLAAWDNEVGGRAGLPDAVAALRTALAGKPARTPCDASAPRKPREGTKQAQVLALLRRPQGTTVAQIVEATGWQQHTVRGFFAGLKKRQGITETAAERVRQASTDGAKGSYSVYRIADAG
jgi:hypothetical protein